MPLIFRSSPTNISVLNNMKLCFSKYWLEVLLMLLLAAFFCAAFYPFKWQVWSPRSYHNGAQIDSEGLHFRTQGIARTLHPPKWLTAVRTSSTLSILLSVKSNERRQYGPARIFTVSLNPSRRNITVAQSGSDLVIRLRTIHGSLNGTPEYVIRGVFHDTEWRKLSINIIDNTMTVTIDDSVADTILLSSNSLSNWSEEYYLALGNELLGERSWLGSIKKVEIIVDGKHIDYLLPGALATPEAIDIPDTYRDLPRIQIVPFSMQHARSVKSSITDWVVNFLGFIPLGFLLMQILDRSRAASVVMICFLVSLSLECGQIFLSSRISSTDDLILNSFGGFIGVVISRRMPLRKLGTT